jgi:hypothetical protein
MDPTSVDLPDWFGPDIVIVAITATAMLAIVIGTLVSVIRRRRADAAAAARRLPVQVRFLTTVAPHNWPDRYMDPLETQLDNRGLGDLHASRQRRAPAPDGTSVMELDIVLAHGAAGLPGLKSALRAIGAPADTILTYRTGGIETLERLSR